MLFMSLLISRCFLLCPQHTVYFGVLTLSSRRYWHCCLKHEGITTKGVANAPALSAL